MDHPLSEEQLRLIESAIQQADVMLFALKLDSEQRPQIVFANQHALKRFGSSANELIGTPFDAFVGDATNPIIVEQLQCLQDLNQLNQVGMYYPPHGQPFQAHWKLWRLQQPNEVPIYWMALIHDITAQQRAQDIVWQRQRIESLGVLAAGIAHDFNNLLAVILGNASMAAGELPPGSDIREMITPIEVAARRAAELTRQMLTYAGQDRMIAQSLDINQLICELCVELSPSLPPNVYFDMRLDSSIPPTIADITQIRRAIRNLMVNAYESMVPTSGAIQISTDLFQIDEEYIGTTVLAPTIPAGTHIRIAIRDSGAGIRPELRGRVFEPFFTTKFIGRGLGLSEALGIVSSHRGTIKIESIPDRGTVSTLTLPLLPNAISSTVITHP